MINLKNKNVIIVAHVFTTVPAEDLKQYFLNNKTKYLLFIGHPLFNKKGGPGSYYKLYKSAKLIKEHYSKNAKIPGVFQYIKDLFLTIYWVMKLYKRWDIFIALNNLNAIAGLFLRRFGIVKKVVYYTIDFVPNRFENKFLNELYHYLDKIAVKHANVTWNLTDRMAEGREKIRNLSRKEYNNQVTVPIGIWFKRIPRISFENIEWHTLVYAGGILPHQGIQLVLQAVPLILKKIPNFKFKIIGIGSYEDELREKVKNLKINKYVQFLGYMEKHEDVEKVLSSCGVAVAMYSKELAKWSYYADPSKIKTYLATGLPIVTTSLTHIAKELEKRQCGIVIPYRKKDLADSIISVMSNEKQYKKMRENSIKFAQEFEWNRVFDNALKTI